MEHQWVKIIRQEWICEGLAASNLSSFTNLSLLASDKISEIALNNNYRAIGFQGSYSCGARWVLADFVQTNPVSWALGIVGSSVLDLVCTYSVYGA